MYKTIQIDISVKRRRTKFVKYAESKGWDGQGGLRPFLEQTLKNLILNDLLQHQRQQESAAVSTTLDAYIATENAKIDQAVATEQALIQADLVSSSVEQDNQGD